MYTKIPKCCDSDNAIPSILNPENELGFKLLEGEDISIVESEQGGVKTFTISYSPYAPPTLSLTTSPSVAEVGSTIPEVVFTGSVKKGKLDISSATLTPTVSDVDIDDNFSFTKTNVTSNELGKYPLHELKVVDSGGNEFTVSAGVDFQCMMYQGYSALSVLNETQVKALVNKSVSAGIKSLYGGKKSYNVPNNALLQYIWWVYPVETAGIVGATLSGLPFPLVDAGRVNITNDYSVTNEYVLMRSAGAFGQGVLDITIN